jgi:hypothetical protein
MVLVEGFEGGRDLDLPLLRHYVIQFLCPVPELFPGIVDRPVEGSRLVGWRSCCPFWPTVGGWYHTTTKPGCYKTCMSLEWETQIAALMSVFAIQKKRSG